MRVPGARRRIRRGVRKALHLLARPMRGDRGHGGLVIHAYRGYGSERELFLVGRVFLQAALHGESRYHSLRRDMADIRRRITRRGIAEAEVVARFHGCSQTVYTDDDGYFCIHLHPDEMPESDSVWHRVHLTATADEEHADAHGEVFVPQQQARFVVISDIDDTVMHTGVANKAKMVWNLFFQEAQSRLAFPGVAAFYRALHEGTSGGEQNPMLYVSRGPWGIYEVLEEFFHLHRIPAGPVLFLREWGIRMTRPVARKATNHKLNLIREMMSVYQGLPFVLIGDSGQRDPEIYSQVVRDFPGRVTAVYIRNVSLNDDDRRQAIEVLAEEAVEHGVSLLLAADSEAMAAHAVEHDLIPARVLEEVRAECADADAQSADTVTVTAEEGDAADLDAGRLDRALEQEGDATPHRPANVAVEPRRQKSDS